MTHPTDALRLVPRRAVFDWLRDDVPLNVKMTVMPHHVDALMDRLSAAAPASPRPGGGQCSGISGELDPRLVEWGYTSLEEAITHLGKLLDDQAAFDGLAHNGKSDLQKMQNNAPRNAPRGLSDEC